MARTFSPMGKVVIASTFVVPSSRRGVLSNVVTRIFLTVAGLATGTRNAFAGNMLYSSCSGSPCTNESVCARDGSCAGMGGGDDDCPENPWFPHENEWCWNIVSDGVMTQCCECIQLDESLNHQNEAETGVSLELEGYEHREAVAIHAAQESYLDYDSCLCEPQ